MSRKNRNQQPDMLGPAPGNQLHSSNESPVDAPPLHENTGRGRRVLVWVILISCSISGLVGMNAIVNPPIPEITASDVTSGDVNASIGKSLAHDQLVAWLGSNPSPLPGGYLVSWDGFSNISGGTPKSASDRPADAAELHAFTLGVATSKGTAFYDATVLVNVDPVRGAVSAAAPTLMPRVAASSQGWSSQVWPDYETSTTSDAMKEAAVAWADAFTDTPAALRLYVGDEDATHSYVPLAGGRPITTNILATAYKMADGVKEKNPKTVIARIEILLAWGAPTGGQNDNKGTKVSYDVLIHGADTASPRIVAWGAAGTGPTLKKFGNAFAGVKEASAPKPSQAPVAPSAAPVEPEAPAEPEPVDSGTPPATDQPNGPGEEPTGENHGG